MVLLIIGVATAMASVSAFGDNGARALRQDAMRLAQLFTVAQAEARASGQAIAWEHDSEGYYFLLLPRRLMLPARMAARASQAGYVAIASDSPLRARAWEAGPIAVRIDPAGDLIFGADWITGPLEVQLDAGGQTVRLSRLGSGRFVVNP